MAGNKNSGRGGRYKQFKLDCTFGSAVGVIDNALIKDFTTLTPAEVEKWNSKEEVERREIAVDVFKKLAPSNINIGGQKENPINTANVVRWIEAGKKP